MTKDYGATKGRVWIRRFVTLGSVLGYLVLDLYEAMVEAEAYRGAGLLSIHHGIQVVVAGLVCWSMFREFQLHHAAQIQLGATSERLERLSDDLQAVISEQVNTWHLSQAETEVAWMLLRGMRFGDMASARKVTEPTLRQQASSI